METAITLAILNLLTLFATQIFSALDRRAQSRRIIASKPPILTYIIRIDSLTGKPELVPMTKENMPAV